jgi:ABC-2 type transport system permease protein
MTLWQMEWARLFRTRRWIALAAGFMFFGLIGPIVTRYQRELFKSLGGGIKVIIPAPTPPDGIASYVKNASQIGLVVLVAVAAASLAIDAKPEWSSFLRTRARSAWSLIAPRFAVNAVAGVVAFIVGALAAWYETAVLIGGVSVGAMVLGILYGALYLAFVVAVVAFATGLTRSTVGAIGVALVVLVLLPLLGSVPVFEPWVPSRLVGALDGLVRGASAADYSRSAAVTVALSVAALWGTARLTARREL